MPKKKTAKTSHAVKLSDALATWKDLNDFLRTCNEADAKTLLLREKQGAHRQQFLNRIHARINRLRRVRERAELLA